MGVSGGSSSSSPVNMTPKSFQSLQGPYAAVIGQLLGYNITNPDGSPVNPVNFNYPAGQFVQGYNNKGQPNGMMNATSAGQIARPGYSSGSASGNMYDSTGRYSGMGGGSSNAGTGQYPVGGGGSGASSAPGSPGYYLSNPNLGTGNPNDILNGIPTYQGPLTAGLGSNEQSLLDMLMGQANGSSSTTPVNNTDAATAAFLQRSANGQYLQPDAGTAGLGAFNQAVNGAHATADYNSQFENPYLQDAIAAAQRPTLQGLTETLTRDLPGRFTQAGQFVQPGGTSAFDRAAAIASRGAADALGTIATNMSYQQFNDAAQRSFQANQNARAAEDTSMQGQLTRQNQNEQGALNRQMQGAGITPSVTQAQVGNLVQNLQAQALPRLIQEYGIERGMQEFNNRTNSLLSVLGIAGGVTQPTVAQQSSSSQAGVNLK